MSGRNVDEVAERVTQAHDEVRGRQILDEINEAGASHRTKQGGEEET